MKSLPQWICSPQGNVERVILALPPVPTLPYQDGGPTSENQSTSNLPSLMTKNSKALLLFPNFSATCPPVHLGTRTLTQFHKQLINCLNDVGLKLGIREAEILAQASGCQEFVQGLLLVALIAASVESMEATRPQKR